MSRNVREEILVRMEAALKEADGLLRTQNVYRNRSDIETMEKPCAVLLDGSFSRVNTLRRTSGRGPDIKIYLMEMTPQTFVFLKERKEARAAERGPELSEFIMVMTRAIVKDTQLLELVGSNGNVVLDRVDTDMQNGAPAQGILLFHWALQFVLDPDDL